MTDRGDDDADEVPETALYGRRPLDQHQLNELALAYVGRFATTRTKLQRYLRRKLFERGWDGASAPDIDGLTEHFAGRGYVDDSAFAEAKARSLLRKGYGPRRVAESIRSAGVGDQDSGEALREAQEGKLDAALAFARRRRWGPYGTEVEAVAPATHQKRVAAFLRAGHDARLAQAILRIAPGGSVAHLEQGGSESMRE